MRFWKISIALVLTAAVLLGCTAQQPDQTNPGQTGPNPSTTLTPTQPTQATDPTDPTQATDPAEPSAPTDPAGSEPSAETEQPTEPESPTESEPPTEPEQPTEPAACSHTYQTESSPATCTSSGWEKRTCVHCGAQETKTLNALGHAYGSGTVLEAAATCADTGTIHYDCSRCGSSYDTIYRGNHRFERYTGSTSPGLPLKCRDCDRIITDFYTWWENSFSDCDKTAALYTDTIRLKEPVYTGLMSQWSNDWLEWHDHILVVLGARGADADGGVTLALQIPYENYGGTTDSLMAEWNRFLDAFQSVYGWRPVWTQDSDADNSYARLLFDTDALFPLYEKATNSMSSSGRDALVKELIAFHIHRMDLRDGMQLYNSVGVICDYMQYHLLRYDNNYRYNSAFRGLTSGITMCQGYAEIFQLFAEYCGIQCQIVEGTLMGRGHAWNRVIFSDGTVRYVDVTNLGQDYYILVPWSAMSHYFKMK